MAKRTATIWLMCVAAVLTASCDQIQDMMGPRPHNGAYAIVEVDRVVLQKSQLETVSDQMAEALRGASIRYNGRGVDEDVARVRLVDAADSARAIEVLTATVPDVGFSQQPDGSIEARLSEQAVETLVNNAVLQSEHIIQRRLAPLRLRATVMAHGPGRLVIRTDARELPNSVRDMMDREGRITFHLVRDDVRATDEHLPPSSIIAPPFFEGDLPEVLKERPEFTGENIATANPSTDAQTGQFVLSFSFDNIGKQRFCRITRDHVGQRFAILFDGRVLTAPTINEAICGGSGQISGNFTAESANELAIIMRSGALPAPFSIVSEGVGDPPAP